MDSEWQSGLQRMTILTFWVKNSMLLHINFEHPKNINTRKQKPSLFSVGILQKRTQNTHDKNQEENLNFTLQFSMLWIVRHIKNLLFFGKSILRQLVNSHSPPGHTHPGFNQWFLDLQQSEAKPENHPC